MIGSLIKLLLASEFVVTLADMVSDSAANDPDLVADDDDSQWVMPDFSWKGQTQFYPDGTPWKRPGPQSLFDYKECGGYFDGWARPSDGRMPDGRYNFGLEDHSREWYEKIAE